LTVIGLFRQVLKHVLNFEHCLNLISLNETELHLQAPSKNKMISCKSDFFKDEYTVGKSFNCEFPATVLSA